ncbi:CLP protease proteolytic subunit 1 [Artemisia annua]|uniref:ATP-dependent Clp protease proteolytic subunit n=1 Tax=Artemisia annua TaxID=35608 RepID=A0A2U1N190_ARTAN|nr:CLP protease proteolytic subunit 1 [Artemisia annua]
MKMFSRAKSLWLHSPTWDEIGVKWSLIPDDGKPWPMKEEEKEIPETIHETIKREYKVLHYCDPIRNTKQFDFGIWHSCNWKEGRLLNYDYLIPVTIVVTRCCSYPKVQHSHLLIAGRSPMKKIDTPYHVCRIIRGCLGFLMETAYWGCLGLLIRISAYRGCLGLLIGACKKLLIRLTTLKCYLGNLIEAPGSKREFSCITSKELTLQSLSYSSSSSKPVLWFAVARTLNKMNVMVILKQHVRHGHMLITNIKVMSHSEFKRNIQKLFKDPRKIRSASLGKCILCLDKFRGKSTGAFIGGPVRKERFVRRFAVKASLDYNNNIPKQFREGNLKDGLMDNYKNVPQYLYGLSPSQMDMFMTEDNPVRRQAESITEDTISSAHNYLNHGGMWSSSGMDDRPSAKYSMSVSMYRGGGRAAGRPRSAPPDLPSLLLDARICYLGMPIVPAVTELLVAQFMWLDYDNPSKPIYLYINSSGTQNDKMETVGSETEAYAIADIMSYCKSDVYTVNCGMAFGQAAMLLALGTKGYRAMQPNSSTKLYLPKVNRSSGAAIDMWIKAKELDTNTDYFLELLEKGIGKPKDEINKDIMRPKYFQAQEAIDYGIADKIISSRDNAFDKRNYDEILAQSKAARRGAGGAQAAPSGFRFSAFFFHTAVNNPILVVNNIFTIYTLEQQF